MSKQEYAKAMLYLGTTYGKEISKAQMQIWYEHFVNVSYDALIRAIKKLSVVNTFMPSLAELIKECQKVEVDYRLEILEKMYQDGYFKRCVVGEQSELEESSDYNKAIGFISAGIFPSWLEADMKEYGYNAKVPLTYESKYTLTAGNYLE